ncbi:50S ribosomal protein L20 [Candidatus Saccharibacteria bacterium]|nr:50S ribosomal protein L20 [Candidatus Saccharibacteria bacterium]
MVRAKGAKTQKRHKKILKEARGYRGARHKQYRRAKEAVLHAGQYAFAGRKLRRRDLRSLWIKRINAALGKHDLTYSRFVSLLKKSGLDLSRKILAQLAVEEPAVFDDIVEKVLSSPREGAISASRKVKRK